MNDMVALITALFFATILSAAWLALLFSVTSDDWISAAYSNVYDCLKSIDKLRSKDALTREKISKLHGIPAITAKIFLTTDSKKAIRKYEHKIKEIQRGNLKKISIFVMPGYVLQRKYDAIGKGSIHRTILSKCFELYGKKHAPHKAKSLLSKLLSYPIIGVAVTLMIGASVIGFGNTTAGFGIVVIGTSLILVAVYAMYDELSDKVNKRREAIIKQFPGVISKLALLMTSGMIMNRAWKETAYSQGLELYSEMRATSEELDNLVSPEAAYGNFIARCNTKETAKLASAITQNLSKGNSEIGRLLKEMAKEAWQERRHTAKRNAEKANSKLMIPTMLLLLAVLLMLMVPIAMNFSAM
jgi:tight adherence protein C